jgi:hypothetical protein
MPELRIETKEQDSSDHLSRIRTYNLSSVANDQHSLPAVASSPKMKAQSSIPLRAADFIVQNPPPGDSLTSCGEFDLREAEKLVDLVYAWGHLEVASSAMANAYERLKGVGEQQLPARSLRQRMRKFRQAAREVESLLPKKNAHDTKEKGTEGADAEEKDAEEKD